MPLPYALVFRLDIVKAVNIIALAAVARGISALEQKKETVTVIDDGSTQPSVH